MANEENPSQMKVCDGFSFFTPKKLRRRTQRISVVKKYQDCWNEYVSLAEAAIFEYAFKLGMTIAIETLTNN